MKAVCSVAVRVGVCLVAFCMSASAKPVTVTGSQVNVRAIADPRSEIVGQVSKGDVLTATGVTRDGWVEIEAPATVSAWVYGELVRNEAIAASRVRVRSGPGIGYRPVGTLSKGQAVSVLESKGDWLRIAPPPSCTVWISADYISDGKQPPASSAAVKPPSKPAVRNIPEPEKRPGKRPVRATRTPPPMVRTPPPPKPGASRRVVITKPVMPSAKDEPKPTYSRRQPKRPSGSEADTGKPRPAVASPATWNLQLVRNAPQGREVIVTGELRPAGFFPLRRPSPYRLVLTKGVGPAETTCYVIGDRDAIVRYLDTRVTLVGKEYWVQGVKEPVVAVTEFRQ